jgi:protein SCO1
MKLSFPRHTARWLRCSAAAAPLCLLSGIGLTPTAASAQDSFSGSPQQRADLQGVGLTRMEGASIPLGLEFRDTQNRTRKVGELFEPGGPPVILLPVYFDCPVICPTTLNQAFNALRDNSDWTPGDQYRLLVLSFDHRDTARSANIQRESFLLKFPEPPLENGIEFWTGTTQNILALTQSVGFGYRFVPGSGHFSHTSAMIFLTNEGIIHNYLPGTKYTAQQVRTGVLEASANEERTIWDQVALLCRVMDESTGEYVISPMRVMQLVGAATVVALSGGIAVLVVTNRLKDRPSL